MLIPPPDKRRIHVLYYDEDISNITVENH
jgi:hypothetical protein